MRRELHLSYICETLQIDSTIGHYRIVSKLGEGGMGEVYRARDTRLGRDVAIKILPAAFAKEAGRVERFQREAQVLACLNHPNIAAIYGIEERALVMELVEGPTLEERIAKGSIPLEEALLVARQIAEALEYAHERGVVHRDLKPANIKLTPEGRAKVLDFGLAKLVASEAGPGDPESSPTLTIHSTVAGTILGTAAYMSPEQARGQAVERRADIWAFGAVLYEMLTGRRAFAGSTVVDTLTAVVHAEPDYSLCPPNLPPRIAYLLQRCLCKKSSERLRDIGEARILIQEAGQTPAPERRNHRRWWIAMIAAITAVIAATAAGIVAMQRLGHPAAAAVPVWKGTFLGGPSRAMGPRISPDGKLLAFQAMVDGAFQVAVMKPESGNWTVLTRDRTHGSVQKVVWSPDGTRLYYARFVGSSRRICSVPVLGGEEHVVLEGASTPEILPDGTLLVLKTNGKGRLQLQHFWPETGKIEPLPAELALDDLSPPMRIFPDGKEAAYIGWPAGDPGAIGTLYALDLATGKSRRLAPDQVITPFHGGLGSPMAITPDGQKVLLRLWRGDMAAVVAIPRNGRGAPETWLNLTQNIWFMDAGPDGSLYLDQALERSEAIRFPAAGGRPERLLSGIVLGPVVESADGSLLASGVFAGRRRVGVRRSGGDLQPVSETHEEMGTSITQVGPHAVAFPLGSEGKMSVAIASLSDGRIFRRSPVQADGIRSIASSPDGRRMYYVAGRTVWSMDVENGQQTRIGAADSVAANADEVVLQTNATDGFHLYRLSPAGGAPMEVRLSSVLPPSGVTLHPTAVGPHGRVLVLIDQVDSWYYRAATVELDTGRLNVIPVEYEGDIWYPGWTPDGKIVATGVEYSFSLWQMRHQE